jgi:hypothetical protein
MLHVYLIVLSEKLQAVIVRGRSYRLRMHSANISKGSIQPTDDTTSDPFTSIASFHRFLITSLAQIVFAFVHH